MKFFLGITISSILLLAACNKTNKKGNLVISGDMKNIANGMVFLDEVTSNNFKSVDTAEVKNGSFTLSYNPTAPSIARVRFSDNKSFLFMVEPNRNITVNGDINVNNDLTFKGSALSQNYVDMVKKLQTNPDPQLVVNYIDTTTNPLPAISFINILSPEKHLDSYVKLAAKLDEKLPGSTYATQFGQQVAAQKAAMSVSVGQPAPDLEFPTPDGALLKLSSSKGKVVLLDFWASWCGPCRRSNPEVVALYNKYKAQGFTIFSVSLDNAKDKWIAAIEKDNLSWKNHISDLKGWQSDAAKTYGVQSIPKTFLLDKSGVISGVNLHGEELENKVKELL